MNQTLKKPVGCTALEDAEMMYVEGGYIVYQSTLTGAQCLNYYKIATQYSAFLNFVNGMGNAAASALATAFGVATAGASWALTLVGVISNCFSWYSTMVDTFARSTRNGAKITFYSNGEVYVMPK